eukprot:TRINITY_DN28017_c0_g1_i3.p1 TRINITY_DN28017_c0_g1~~TRINITY_DN28017_c0_g1_i3.p1  ORF type:complete len:262 (+),score=14.12 TRINITY_DN28017_c0_g1_i3:254-1039(+)
MWGLPLAALTDVFVRIGFAYANSGGIAMPHFACAMVTHGDLRTEHCALLVLTEVVAVLLGRWTLLMALPSGGAGLLLPESLAMANGLMDDRVWHTTRARLFGSCRGVVGNTERTIVLAPMLSSRTMMVPDVLLCLQDFGYHLTVSALFCMFIFNSLDWCGRFAATALAVVGTTTSYGLALMNPAWGAASALVECDNAHRSFFAAACGALVGGALSGAMQRQSVHFRRWRAALGSVLSDGYQGDLQPGMQDAEATDGELCQL